MLVMPIRPSSTLSEVTQPINEKIDQLIDGKAQGQELKTPEEQSFAFGNVQMNMDKNEAEKILGKPKDSIDNEYGTKWYVYHDRYRNFVMVSYINDKVNGLYTNQNIITSKNGLKYNSPKASVRDQLGEPLTEIKKGNIVFQQNNNEYDVFNNDNIYTTVFYDQHENNQVTGMMLISETLENRLKQQYASPSKSLAQSSELEDFYLINATRVQKGLTPLEYNDQTTTTARKHSNDMAENHYFDHTNLEGKSPFDRLKDDGISYRVAAENLSYGQVSGIYAHHGLMNSLGHRKNILNKDVHTLGVGVDFNSRNQPYWTELYTN